MEDHINTQNILCELADYKSIYTELTGKRCCDIYKQYLQSDSTTTKANIYVLLQTLASKFKSQESFQKRINISNFQDCNNDDMLCEDAEEDVMIYKDNQES